MKKVITYTLITFTLLGIFVYWMAYEGGKSREQWELKKERAKIFEQEKKEYMTKIDYVSLFGIFLRAKVSLWLLNPLDKNDLGMYKGKKFEGWDLSYGDEMNKQFNIQISPSVKTLVKNENFIDYYVSYEPYSEAVYQIIGVLPKKYIDFVPEDSRKWLGPNYFMSDIYETTISMNYEKCVDYLKPLLEVINDGIKQKTDLLPIATYDGENSKKQMDIVYLMNSNIEYIWGDNESQTLYFDKSPEEYFGIVKNDKIFLSNEQWKKYKTKVIELVGHCNPYRPKDNLYISLTHSIIEDWVHAKVIPVYWKEVEKKKLSEEEKALQKKKLSIDNTGLQ